MDVLLRGYDGRETRFTIPKQEEFPGIIVWQDCGFYKVGSRDKGKVGLYDQCTTHTIIEGMHGRIIDNG